MTSSNRRFSASPWRRHRHRFQRSASRLPRCRHAIPRSVGWGRLTGSRGTPTVRLWLSAALLPRRDAFTWQAQLLLQDPSALAQLGRCPGHACGWLFLDPLGRRRWCIMAICGNREKARRHAARSCTRDC